MNATAYYFGPIVIDSGESLSSAIHNLLSELTLTDRDKWFFAECGIAFDQAPNLRPEVAWQNYADSERGVE
jgi:hypothetical protein